MIVSAPADEEELQHLLYTALKAGQPMAIRYPRGQGQGKVFQSEMHSFPIGKGEILKKGSDLGIISIGYPVSQAVEAANLLANEGIDCEVVNARFAKPLDSELILELSQRISKIITIEEGIIRGGFGSAVLELLNKSGSKQVKVECIGLPDQFVEHGKPEIFRSKYDLDSKGIVRRVNNVFPELFKK
jgi:1-deoxy-D-xylulose-5-phosphate synthase